MIYVLSEVDYDWTATIGCFKEYESAVREAERLWNTHLMNCEPHHWHRTKDWSFLYMIEEVELK